MSTDRENIWNIDWAKEIDGIMDAYHEYMRKKEARLKESVSDWVPLKGEDISNPSEKTEEQRHVEVSNRIAKEVGDTTKAELEDKIIKGRIEGIKDERAKKVAKFLLDYSFHDKKEVYTNGTLLVPMYRVIDALDMINMDEIGYSTI